MNCINLKDRFGKKYRIGLNPAAKHEPGGMHDPWMFTIRCQFGEIYPYGGEKLAFHCTGGGIRIKLKRAVPGLEISNWSDVEEAIFIFHIDQFPEVAKFAKPRRRRHLSENHRRKLTKAGTEALEKYRLQTLNRPTEVKNGGFSGELPLDMPRPEKVENRGSKAPFTGAKKP